MRCIIYFCNDNSVFMIPKSGELNQIKNKAGVTVLEYQQNGNAPCTGLGDKEKFDILYMYGSHGDVQGGRPVQLNGLNEVNANGLIQYWKSKKISVREMVLDCCFSMAWLPQIIDLVEPDGVVIGSIPSLNATMSPFVVKKIENDQTVEIIRESFFEKELQAAGMELKASTYGVYFKDTGTMHRCSDKTTREVVKNTMREQDWVDGNAAYLNLKSKKTLIRKETIYNTHRDFQRSYWAPDAIGHCQVCQSVVSWGKRHHCRLCGKLICNACSTARVKAPGGSMKTRTACTACKKKFDNKKFAWQ
jgi:hypothetical protein